MSKRQFGSIRKLRSGRYQARYRDATGRMVPAPETFKARSDAGRWLSTVEADMARGTFLDPKAGKRSVGAWSEDWLASKRGQRANTLAKDRAALRYALPIVGSLSLSSVTPLHVRRVVDAMRDAGLSPSSVSGYLNTVSSLFAAAVEAELIARSPVRRRMLALEAVEAGARPHLTPSELVALAEAVPARFGALVLTAGVLGLRWSEAIALRPDAVEFLPRRLSVVRTVEEVGGHLRLVEATKSAAGRRSVAVPAVVVDALAAHMAAHRPRIGPDELLFVGAKGAMLRRNFLARTFKPAAARLGIADGLTFHGLRHVAATYLEEVDAPLRVRQHRLGHAPQGVTLGVYTHVPDELDRAVADRLGTLFAPALERPVCLAAESEP